jgi:hypothetical protein
MKRKLIICLLIVFTLGTAYCTAAAEDNALAAIALYIDTSGHYVPGCDLLNKALNEVIRFKVNALFLGSEVQSGNEVLRDLGRLNVASAAEATPEALSAYSESRHVNYVILLSVRPLDVALDIKAYSAASNSYVVDKTVTRPDGTEALSTLDALSGMLGDELAQVLQTIHGS